MGNNTEDSYTERATIVKIDDSVVTLEILKSEACGSCVAKGVCSTTTAEKKTVQVHCKTTDNHKVGDIVNLIINSKTGLRSAIIVYLIPVLLMIITILISGFYGLDEVIAAALTLGILTLYFIVLYIYRKKIDNRIHISIEKFSANNL